MLYFCSLSFDYIWLALKISNHINLIFSSIWFNRANHKQHLNVDLLHLSISINSSNMHQTELKSSFCTLFIFPLSIRIDDKWAILNNRIVCFFWILIFVHLNNWVWFFGLEFFLMFCLTPNKFISTKWED